jgi:DNA-binding transcriptional LysR family regulator
MRLEQLQYIVTVADTKLINIAANKLYVTPQAVSKGIKQLEDELKTPLFKRTKYGMYLTEDGQLVYNVARDILKQVDYLKENFEPAINKKAEDIEGNINILAPASMSIVLYKLTNRFIKRYERAHVYYEELEGNRILSMLEGNENMDNDPDIIFVNVNRATFDKLYLFKDSFQVWSLKEETSCVLMSARSRYATQQSISLKTVASLPLAGFISSTVNNHGQEPFLSQMFRDYGVELNFVLVSNSFHTWYKAITDGLAYGIVGNNFMGEYMDSERGSMSNTVTVPIKEKIATVIAVLVPKNKERSPQAAAFFREITNYYRKTMYQL